MPACTGMYPGVTGNVPRPDRDDCSRECTQEPPGTKPQLDVSGGGESLSASGRVFVQEYDSRRNNLFDPLMFSLL